MIPTFLGIIFPDPIFNISANHTDHANSFQQYLVINIASIPDANSPGVSRVQDIAQATLLPHTDFVRVLAAPIYWTFSKLWIGFIPFFCKDEELAWSLEFWFEGWDLEFLIPFSPFICLLVFNLVWSFVWIYVFFLRKFANEKPEWNIKFITMHLISCNLSFFKTSKNWTDLPKGIAGLRKRGGQTAEVQRLLAGA